MLQHRAALCQPIHDRMAHFVPSIRSQFFLQAADPPCERTVAAARARFAGVSG
jgi:hypothetical protein